jgi:DNA polymerase III delta subunit
MKNIIMLSCILFYSCEYKTHSIKTYNTTNYEIEKFEKKVVRFLIQKNIFNPKTIYFIYNTEGCSACIDNKLRNLTTYLKNNNKKTTVFISNSKDSIISKNFRLVIFPKKTFEQFKIWHSDIYEYSFDAYKNVHSRIINETYFQNITN